MNMGEKLVFRTPVKEDKAIILDYKEEFIKSGDSLDGTGGLLEAKTFEEWFGIYEKGLSEETVPEGWVPATTFLAIGEESGRLMGFINIRHRLNERLLLHGGNIGYSVRASERRKGYASRILGFGLSECRKLGMDRVLLTCNKTNTASAKTMLHHGAALENEITEAERVTQRYWITL